MGEGKETCPETRDEIVNIWKMSLDWDSDLLCVRSTHRNSARSCLQHDNMSVGLDSRYACTLVVV
jgi:hypothetical protein